MLLTKLSTPSTKNIVAKWVKVGEYTCMWFGMGTNPLDHLYRFFTASLVNTGRVRGTRFNRPGRFGRVGHLRLACGGNAEARNCAGMVITDRHDHVIDDKNRLSIPSQIRNAMDPERDGEGFYLVPEGRYLQ